MTFNIVHGMIKEAKQILSPNFNQRPTDDIHAIIIHNISLPPNQFGLYDNTGKHLVSALFTNTLDWQAHPYFQSIKGLQVSAHLLIERDGTVTQYVNLNDRAWHAGQSCYLGKTNCNDYSIGIELEGTDDTPFDDRQYAVLAKLIHAIHLSYPATRRQLTGHSDIAPKRKTDPGAYFDWQRLRHLIHQTYQTA